MNHLNEDRYGSGTSGAIPGRAGASGEGHDATPPEAVHVPEEFADKYTAIQLDSEAVKRLRHLLHELANVFTGVLVTGGLLHHALDGDLRQRYTGEICTGGERGAALVREARTVLLHPSERLRI